MELLWVYSQCWSRTERRLEKVLHVLPNTARSLHWEGIAALLKAPCGGPRSKSYLKGWSQLLYALLLMLLSSCFKPLLKALNQSQGLEWQFAVICRALLSNSLITFDDLTKTHIPTLELRLFPLLTFPSVEINFEVKEICCTSKWACGQVPITKQIKRRGYLHAPWHTSFAASAFTMMQTFSSHDQKLSQSTTFGGRT